MHLRSQYFKGNQRLEKVTAGASLVPGERGHSVALLQAALLGLKYKLPVSTWKKHGAPDGVYGNETREALRKFQSENKLSPTGILNRETILRLDALLPVAPPAKLPKPPPSAPPLSPAKAGPSGGVPISPDFTIGTADPKITPDAGAGPWGSKPKTALTLAFYVGLWDILPEASVFIGKDAAKHLAHYLENTGTTQNIDLEGMIAAVPSARTLFELEVAKIKDYVEHLPPGTYDVTAKHAVGGYDRKSESQNWFYAVGGYSAWAKGRATVVGTGPGHDCRVELEYRFYDRYNWDHGKAVTVAGIVITDDRMGEFQLEGLAREYDNVGAIHRTLQWKAGQSVPASQLSAPGGRAGARVAGR